MTRRFIVVAGWIVLATSVLGQPTPSTLPEVIVEGQPPQPAESAPAPASDAEPITPQFFSNAPAPGERKFGMTVPGSIPWGSGVITRDSQRVGSYGQPAWTTQRPFATSRTYVLPAGTAQLETWVRPTWGQEGKPEFRFLHELAVGLPGRIQIDIYERWGIEENANGGQQGSHQGNQYEIRYALADWGKIPFNPTLYFEWVEKNGGTPDVYEIKLLFAEQFGPRLFYASNLILEQEDGGAKETEFGWSTAFATPIIERKLMGGIEMLLQRNTVKGERGDPVDTFRIGPSLQLRPTNRTFITATALFGTTADSPICQAYFIFGYQFGFRAGPAASYFAPSSTIGN
ncbi:hypothetical protein K2X85_15200 [bacterium]|nr:hypothetical protein [bacterium]